MTITKFDITQKKGNFSFHFKGETKNSITGIFGSSGSGKTTLLQMLSGIEKPLSGYIRFDNKELFNTKEKINLAIHQRKVGYVFQDARLFPHLTVIQNLTFGYNYLPKKPDTSLLEKVIDLLELNTLLQNKPWQLSGGQQQRVAIGRALLTEPDLLLLDEPFSNLDKKLRKQIISYLLRVNKHIGTPMLVVSHDLEDLLRLSPDIMIIQSGTIACHDNYFNLYMNKSTSPFLGNGELLSIVDARIVKYNNEKKLLYLETLRDIGNLIVLQTGTSIKEINMGNMVRVGIKPEDVALSTKKIQGISMQNQWKGSIINIIEKDEGVFCQIDCGFNLLAELTHSSVKNLGITVGKEIFCLIKSKGIELIHMYKND